MTALATAVTCVQCATDLDYVNSVAHGTHTITMLHCPQCREDVMLETVYRRYGKGRDGHPYRHRREWAG